MTKKSSEQIRRHASDNYVSRARRAGAQEFEITVGEVHRDLQMKNRVPQVCAALRSEKFLMENHLVLVGETGPPSGMSTTVRLRYRFRDGVISGATSLPETTVYQKIRDLYGIASELYARLGGGERVLSEDRENFFGTPAGPEPGPR